MSADRPDPTEFVDDRDDDDANADPYGIVPEDFVARSSASTIAGALREAEQQTSRDRRQLPRCPDCLNVRLRRKDPHAEMSHKVDTAYKCDACGEHFDEPAPSVEESMPGEQAALDDVTREVNRR